MKFKKAYLTVPMWAVNPILNQDYDKLSDTEYRKIERFLNKTNNVYGNTNFEVEDGIIFDANQNDVDGYSEIKQTIKCTKLMLYPTDIDWLKTH